MLSNGNFKYLPIVLDIDGKHVLIAGGGKVAARKISVLLNFNLKITVISPEFDQKIQHYSEKHSDKLSLIKDYYRPEHFDLQEFIIVIAATNDESLNKEISDLAKVRGILSNIITSGPDSSFIMPAIVQNDLFQLAITSHGVSPALSKFLKEQINEKLMPGLQPYMKLFNRIKLLIEEIHGDDIVLRHKVYNKVLNTPGLLENLLSEDIETDSTIKSIIRELI